MRAHPDITALLDAIIARPRENALRRVLADALLDSDHPLGDFMVAQLDREAAEAARCAPKPAPRKVSTSRELQHRDPVAAWFELVPSLYALRGCPVHLLGGVIGAVSVTWDHLRNTSWRQGVALEHLDVTGAIPPDGVVLLEAMAGRALLRSLSLASTSLDDTAMTELAALPWPALRWLDVSDNAIGHRGAMALLAADCPRLALVSFNKNLWDPCETAYDARTLSMVCAPDGRFRIEPDVVVEREFRAEAEQAWRRCGQPPWARVLWRDGGERPHRWNLWDSVPDGARSLQGAVVLRGNIVGVDLRRSVWTRANLAATTFDQVDLREADLTSANLDFSKLMDTDSSGVIAPSLAMSHAQLARCDLSGADLRHVCLEDAILTDCKLSGTDLSCSDGQRHMGRTRRTRFVRCDLRAANWQGRELIDAEFVDCRLEGIEGVPWSTEGSFVTTAGVRQPLPNARENAWGLSSR